MAENVRRTLEEGAPLIEQPRETTSIDKEIREPVREGHDCKLFRICTGKENPRYLYVPHFQKKENKREIYKGYYNCDVPIAIVRINPSSHSGPTKKEIGRELQILKELEVHENFIRYFTHEMNNDLLYLATELCLCSVEDLLDPALEKKISMKKEILDELQAKEILRQATRGLSYLHQNNFIHRNIKPNNFLIKDVKTGDKSCRFVVKITDFRLTRKRDPHKNLQLSGSIASEGWEAPESRHLTKDLSTKLDVFILGCFYHYVLVALSKNEANKGKPRHPFGDSSNTRTDNINNIDYFSERELPFVSNDEEEAKVVDLIKKMLKFNEEERPTLQQVLADPYFVPSEDYNIYKFAIPGLCVIFNQEKFEGGEVRKGSERDRNKLKETFNKLGFKTIIYNDQSSYALKTEIKSLAKKDFKDYGCLVVCLLSHGIENAILCYDLRYVNTDELKYEFSLDKCPSLYGKPKIFIVQACQGNLEQSKTGIVAHNNSSSVFSQPVIRIFQARFGLLLTVSPHVSSSMPILKNNLFFYSYNPGPLDTPSTISLTKTDVEPNYTEEDLKDMKIIEDARKNPPIMDFLTINATLPGFRAYRFYHAKVFRGSLFIQSLCEALSEEYLHKKPDDSKQHLEDLLRCVQVKISKCSEELEKNSHGNVFWQTMPWEVCLSKHIRFCKGEKEGTDISLREV